MLTAQMQPTLTQSILKELKLDGEKIKGRQNKPNVKAAPANWRSPEDGIERRTPSKSKYQYRYRYIHNEESLHTENNEKTSSCL